MYCYYKKVSVQAIL